MRFENGNSYGKHNNHRSYGRLTKEQYEALRGLVPKAIDVWRKILEMEVKPRGMSVQSDTASKVLSKFVADLLEYEGTQEHKVDTRVIELLRDIADRVAGKDTSKPDNGKTGDSKGQD